MKKLIYILCLLTCLTSCVDNLTPQEEVAGGIEVGEKVSFTTSVPKLGLSTRALNTELLSGYQTIARDYELTIKMLDASTPVVGSSMYVPVTTNAAGTPTVYDIDGTLEAKANTKPLLWESNAVKYAFEATAGSDQVASDQSTTEKWLRQDRLHGYAFSPFEPENGDAPDVIAAPNYHTSKEWYQLNKAWHDAAGEMKTPEDYKKIPLFMQHERSWVTIILKAGKGVKRETVDAKYNEQDNTYNPNVQASIFSYKSGDAPVSVSQPLVGQASVEYQEDVNGNAEERMNLRFDAIVEPHDYYTNAVEDKIAQINLSGLHFSFFANNDSRFQNPTAENAAALESAYNLTAGKHLTIEATLETSRIVFITAWIEDWTEVVTSTICDDYGRNGDPTVIKSRQDLIDFLGDSDLNSSGNMAIIGATELDLDEDDDPWTNYDDFELKATLNLASATITSSGRLFKTITSTGNLIQGTVLMNNTSPIPSAIAETNEGTIDNISLVSGSSAVPATRAGFVEMNHGYITNSSSSMPVFADDESSDTFIGGIAAQSLPPADNSTIPTIDRCVMYASVNGGNNVKGGGIVGKAQGRLTNNTFAYGITLLQNVEDFKNIIHTANASNMNVSGNAWPTLAENPGAGTNVSDAKYHGVLSSQEELTALLNPSHNRIDYKYRISDSFTVMAESWDYGVVSEEISTQGDFSGGNIYCELDGGGNTITMDAATGSSAHMLFSNITGYVHDLTIELAKPLIAVPGTNSEGINDATDAIAPLAYSVRQPKTLGTEDINGNYGVIRNVKVKMLEDTYVQAATASGLVCWAHRGGVVDNCQVKGSILSWTPDGGGSNDGKRYVGGVVACASQASITNCTYYQITNSKTFDIATGSGKMNTFYGGILGGTVDNVIDGDHDYPHVSIVDCASWYQHTFPNTEEGNNDKLHHGAILGYSYYDKDNITTIGTMTDGDNVCQGNWWQADMDGVARGGVMNGFTIETTIGKRNAVTPAIDNF